MEYDLNKLEKLAKDTLSEKRFHHTQCVVKQAVKLAEIYGCDSHKAAVAAWLHDICKEQKSSEQLQWLTKFGIMLDSVQLKQPKTWHGMAACGFMKEKLGITDKQILHAVACHTTGSGDMSTFDEIIYLADLTSEERDYPDVQLMRDLAENAGTGQAMKAALQYIIGDIVKRGMSISRDSFEAYNRYMEI